jgi:Methylase involved in ubiquinone/menaquinone biosynthesis
MTVLDLGCGVGDQAAELVARGARVIGYDADEELVRAARARALPSAEFRIGNLREELDLDVQVDGIWCSFTAAYFPDLPRALERWGRHLKPDGWIVVTEVDALFGHEPLATETRTLLDAYTEDALAAGRYDFRMGHKLEAHLRQAGFVVSKTLVLADQELSFVGRGQPEVLEAWRNRFARMALLRRFCGEKARMVEDEFMACLESDDHRSLAKVYCCFASKPG